MVNFTISLLPLSKADLLERFPYALDPAFPGISFSMGLIELDKSKWGLPFLLGILPGGDTEAPPLSVAAKEVFTCKKALLRKAAGQELISNATTLAKHWKEVPPHCLSAFPLVSSYPHHGDIVR